MRSHSESETEFAWVLTGGCDAQGYLDTVKKNNKSQLTMALT